MFRTILALSAALFIHLGSAAQVYAQQTAYVQVEAQRTLSRATEKAQGYAARLPDVTGHFLSSGWYGIALGPYSPADADRLLRQLRGAGQIPSDSYIVSGSQFQQQFWPVGVGAATTPQPAPDLGEALSADAATAPEQVEIPVIRSSDETPREARATEAELTRAEKEELQIALQWAGVYGGAIDAAFGRGTRNAMGAWQEANNHEVTGVLTTGQRAELLAAYNAILEGLDLQTVRDDATGIEILIPTGKVAFAEYEPPFARFDPVNDDLPVQVLLISQEGDQSRFAGFYEILQTLEIIPTDGPRERSGNRFFVEGSDAERHTWVEATLQDGQIKGFALIWPAGDEERRSRVLAKMQESFARIDGVLDPALSVPNEDQSIDLLSGLEIRRPTLSRSGFFIDETGTVLTTTEAVTGCERITIDQSFDATVAHLDDALGIAVLSPDDALAPLGVAEFQTGVPRLQAEIAVAGYPFGGILSAPALTFGRLADIRGLNGEDEVKRLSLNARDGDAGGPLFDNGGAVLGMLLPRPTDGDLVLPGDVSIATDADAIITSLSGAGISVNTTDDVAFMEQATLTTLAADMTVLVSCW